MRAEPVDYLGKLSPEIMQKILFYLTPQDVNSIWYCSKKMRDLFNCDYFWRKLCRQNGYDEVEEYMKLPTYESYLERFAHRWQGVLNYNRLLQHNWSNEVSKISMLTENNYGAFYYFDDDILVASIYYSIEQTRVNYTPFHDMNVIDCSTGEIIGKLITPTRLSKVLRYRDKIIFLGDGYIKVWDIPTKMLYRIMLVDYFFERLSRIVSAHAHKTLVGLVHCDKGLSIFDYEEEEIVYSNTNAVIVSIGDEVVTLGLKNGIIKILDFDFRDLMTFYLSEEAVIQEIQIRNDHLLVISRSPVAFHASVWSLTEKMKFIDLYDICQSEYELSSIRGSYFFFASHFRSVEDNINVWKYQQGLSLVLLGSYPNHVKGFKSNSRYLFTMTVDNIQVWCLKTGEVLKDIDDVDINNLGYDSFSVTETKYAYINKSHNIVIRDYAMFLN